MAHRGAMAVCPENTLAGFRRAARDGADIIETDIRIAADGAFVCIHDETVDRTTNGTGRVADMTLTSLKGLEAGAGEYRDERIPTLEELALAIPGDVAVAAELKDPAFLYEETCRRFVRELDRLDIRSRVLVLSFGEDHLNSLRRIAPDLRFGYLSLWGLLPYRAAEMLGPAWPVLFLNPLFVWLAHRRGQMVCPLDPAPDALLRFYVAMGCDALLTDDPARTLQELERLGCGRPERFWARQDGRRTSAGS